MCGRALTPEIDRVMNGASADMVFTDPPYNQKFQTVQGRGRIKHPEFHEASGEQTSPEYIAFLTVDAWEIRHAVSHDGAVHYVCHDWRRLPELHAAATTVYDEKLNLSFWVKTTPGQGSFYRSQHELIGVFRVGQRPSKQHLPRPLRQKPQQFWTYAGMNTFGAGTHRTVGKPSDVKPVALIADAIKDCTTRGDIVLDPFMGSGSTIIAAGKSRPPCLWRRVRAPVCRCGSTTLGSLHEDGSHLRG